MNAKKKRRRLLLCMLAFFALILLVPYIYSRWCASANLVNIRTEMSFSNGERTRSSFRVVAYNIAHGRGLAESNWDGGTLQARTQRLDAIAKLLKELDADVVVLNEVDFDCSWSSHTNQARYLAEKSGYPHWVEQRNLDFRVLGWTWRFGNALLSKHPVTNAKPIDFPAYAKWESVLAGKKRGMSCDIGIIGTEKVIRVFPVHLSPRSERLRVQSCEAILREVQNTKLATVVAGDFNSTPKGWPVHSIEVSGHNAIALMDACGKLNRQQHASVNSEAFTFPANLPDRVIDWVFVPAKAKTHLHRVVSSQLSDHLPVLSEFQIQPNDVP